MQRHSLTVNLNILVISYLGTLQDIPRFDLPKKQMKTLKTDTISEARTTQYNTKLFCRIVRSIESILRLCISLKWWNKHKQGGPENPGSIDSVMSPTPSLFTLVWLHSRCPAGINKCNTQESGRWLKGPGALLAQSHWAPTGPTCRHPGACS